MLPTGSGIERWINCRASSVLHRSFDLEGTDASEAGTTVHEYVARIADGMTREESLAIVDDRYTQRCAEIDLADLRDVLHLSPEVALAYHAPSDSARLLGAALGREYVRAGLGDDEIALTIDLAGIDSNTGVGVVVDFKTGWKRVTPAARNHQMRGAAIALARTFDLDEVRAQLIYLREGVPAKRESATYTAADLAVYAAELRVRHELELADRAAFAQTGREPDSARGSWCRFCPSFHACSAQTSLIRAAVSGDELDGVLRSSPLAPEVIADAWRRLRDLRAPLKLLESTIYASAKERPVLIETLPDGTELWLGETETTGNLKIDAKVAREVVTDMLGADAADEASKYDVTQKGIDTAIKARVGRGFGAAKMRAVMTEIAKRGGSHRPTRYEVAPHKREPRALVGKVGT